MVAIKHIASITGLATAILYSVGYVSDRVHWNLLGHIEIPFDHVELLYRGANVILGSLIDILIYVINDSIEGVSTGLTCWLSIIGIILGFAFSISYSQSNKISKIFPLYAGIFSLLNIIILIVLEFSRRPDIGQNILFIKNYSINIDAAHTFYRAFVVTLVFTGLLFYLFNNVSKLVINNPLQKSIGQIADEKKSKAILLSIRVFRNISLGAFIVMLVFLPMVYGLFKYPNIYSSVDIVFKSNYSRPEDLRSEKIMKYLLYASPEIYVFYIQSANPYILRVSKSEVAHLIISEPRNIFADLCFTRLQSGFNSNSIPSHYLPYKLVPASFDSPKNQGLESIIIRKVDNKSGQKQKTSLLELLRRLSEIRPIETILIRPHGKTLLDNVVAFEWDCIESAAYFIIRVAEEHAKVGKEPVEIWRSSEITTGTCAFNAPIGKLVSDNKRYYWFLDVYRNNRNGRAVLDATDKRSFSFMSPSQMHSIESNLLIHGLDHGGMNEHYMSLVKGVYYYSNAMYYHSRKHFEDYLSSPNTDVYNFQKLIYDVVKKLEKLEQEKQIIMSIIEDHSSSAFQYIQAMKKLINTELLMLQFDSATVHIDYLLPKLQGVEKREYLDQRNKAVVLDNFMRTILPLKSNRNI